MSNTKSIMAAGVITSLVILALVGLNIYNHRLDAQAAADQTAAEVDASTAAYVEALTARQAQLDDAVTAMEARHDSYTAQQEDAHQTIVSLQASIAQMEAQLEANDQKIAEYEPQLVELNNTAWSLTQTRNEWRAKEADYSAQIEAANAQIVALQAQLGQ